MTPASRWPEGVPFFDPPPGAWTLDDRNGARVEAPRWMRIACPSCAQQSLLALSPNAFSNHDSWKWDGDRDAPTLTGQIVCAPKFAGCGWTGQLRAGAFTTGVQP